eukprot:576343-Karenia_brevis.AAC.1
MVHCWLCAAETTWNDVVHLNDVIKNIEHLTLLVDRFGASTTMPLLSKLQQRLNFVPEQRSEVS